MNSLSEFEQYTLLGQVGAGGMGVVYQAVHRGLNRSCALKLIGAGLLATPDERRRFVTEAEATAKLDHPNIVRVGRAAEYEGQWFLEMELVEGGTLADRIAEGPMPPTETAHLVESLARAVQHAHERGILHRDLKPANVLLSLEGQPKLTDFGLARFLEKDSDLTRTIAVLGTPAYLAPELASGRAREATIKADVYSLGIILFECLTGQRPFQGQTPLGILRAVQDHTTPRPSDLRTGVPQDLETICLKCLAKEPDHRFESAGELADELNRFLNGEPIHSRPVSPFERLRLWCRRKPAMASLSGATALLLLAVLLGAPIALLRIDRERREADLARGMAETNAGLAREAALKSRRGQYSSDMFAAWYEINQGNLRRARNLLSEHVPPNSGEDLRGFEWRYFWGASEGRQTGLLDGHSSVVRSLYWSRDGNMLVSASGDKTVRVWNRPPGGSNATFDSYPAPLNTAVVSSDLKYLLTASSDGTVECRDFATKKQRWTTKFSRPLISLSPDGSILAVGTGGDPWGQNGGDVHLLRAENGQRIRVLSKGGDRALFSPDGRHVATANARGLLLWDTAEGQLIRRFPRLIQVLAMSFAPDGRILAAGTRYGEIKLISEDGSDDAVLRQPNNDYVTGLSFTPDGATLAASLSSHLVEIWNIQSNSLLDRYEGHAGVVRTVACSPDGQTLASGGEDGTVRLWSTTPTRREPPVLPGPAVERYARSAQPRFSPDGRYIAVGIRGGHVQLRDAQSLTETRLLHGAGYPAAFSADGRELLTRNLPVTWLRRYNLETGALLAESPIRRSIADVWTDSLSRDQSRLSLAGLGGQVEIIDTTTGEAVWKFRGPGGLRWIELGPDNRTLALAGERGVVELHDLVTRRRLHSLKGHRATTAVATFSPDGRVLASADWSGTAILWDTETGQPLAHLEGHRTGVFGCAFSPDGRTFATSGSHAIKLWNLPSYREVGALAVQEDTYFVAFSSDGRTLATGTRRIHLWRAPAFEDLSIKQVPLSVGPLISNPPPTSLSSSNSPAGSINHPQVNP